MQISVRTFQKLTQHIEHLLKADANRIKKAERGRMMNSNNTSTENNPFIVEISFDKEMSEGLEKHFNQHCMALKNEDFGIGVWFNEDMTFGVYGNDDYCRAVISCYWDKNKESIEQAICAAKSLDELVVIAKVVILSTIVDMLETAEDNNTSNIA